MMKPGLEPGEHGHAIGRDPRRSAGPQSMTRAADRGADCGPAQTGKRLHARRAGYGSETIKGVGLSAGPPALDHDIISAAE
jgi:hypothetical protein